MPYVKVELIAGRTKEQKAHIARIITDALVEHGDARPESVFVVFQDVQTHDWASRGELLSERKLGSGS